MITLIILLASIFSIVLFILQLELVLWSICRGLAKLFNSFNIKGQEHIPRKGAALLVANHASFIDWLMICVAAGRPVRFVMHYSYFNLPFCSFFLKKGKVIAIAGNKEDSSILAKSFEQIDLMLKKGELVCIFPEGQLSSNGQLGNFRPGVEKILKSNPVPVIPIVIKGVWGGFFSLKYKDLKSKLKLIPQTFSKTVEIIVSSAWTHSNEKEVTAKELETYFKTQLQEELTPITETAPTEIKEPA